MVCTHINSMNATPAVESRHLLEILHALTRYIRQVRRLQLHSVAEHLSTAQLRLQDGTCAFIVPARAEGLTLSALSCYTPEKTLPWLLRCSLLRKGERGVVVCKRLELSRFRTPLEGTHAPRLFTNYHTIAPSSQRSTMAPIRALLSSGIGRRQVQRQG